MTPRLPEILAEDTSANDNPIQITPMMEKIHAIIVST
jgi:hypothetical protein